MAKQSAKYTPLALLQYITDHYTGVWEAVEDLRTAKGQNSVPEWDDWCYIPATCAYMLTRQAHALSVLDQFDRYPAVNRVLVDATSICALAPWRMSKEVYCLDADLQQSLAAQAKDVGDDMDIPTDVLLHLPYPCFYVEFAAPFRDYSGMFVYLEHNVDRGTHELSMLYVSDALDTVRSSLFVDGGTIAQSIAALLADCKRVSGNGREPSPADIQFIRDCACFGLQIVLYILSDNSDVAPNSEQTLVTRRTKNVRDKYAEIRKWDVGIRVGNAIRAYRSAEHAHQTGPSGSHQSPRPHIRRAHWHHFWAGKRDGSEERRLVLRWIPPVPVNADSAPADVVTLHPVKSPK